MPFQLHLILLLTTFPKKISTLFHTMTIISNHTDIILQEINIFLIIVYIDLSLSTRDAKHFLQIIGIKSDLPIFWQIQTLLPYTSHTDNIFGVLKVNMRQFRQLQESIEVDICEHQKNLMLKSIGNISYMINSNVVFKINSSYSLSGTETLVLPILLDPDDILYEQPIVSKHKTYIDEFSFPKQNSEQVINNNITLNSLEELSN